MTTRAEIRSLRAQFKKLYPPEDCVKCGGHYVALITLAGDEPEPAGPFLCPQCQRRARLGRVYGDAD